MICPPICDPAPVYSQLLRTKAHITMAVQMFNKMTFSSVYRKYMFPVSDEILNMVLSYVKEKTDGRPLEMAVDAGCGTGRYTLPLALHFKKVLGVDISESQINVAKQHTLANNVSYMVAPAEKLPLKNASVDLVNAALAAHWFTPDKFASEAVRVLKTNGCLAAHAFIPTTKIEYKNFSHELSVVMSEVWDTLYQHDDKSTEHMFCQYRSIYEAIPLKDKERITDISVKVQMSIPEIIGFFKSIFMYQVFMEKDAEGAQQLLIQAEKRLQKILGEEADSALLDAVMTHYCVLACKH
ncbi:putative methyltransferase DDB_G0268948 isoform X2 [Dendropsophus ebraccatus]|uniref:putative methyltransferase DDB_G0268948 isoform X2 n=1 Tax=Dendropsophus ebraccatus TaxID=150705 RepID=UPI003831C3DB